MLQEAALQSRKDFQMIATLSMKQLANATGLKVRTIERWIADRRYNPEPLFDAQGERRFSVEDAVILHVLIGLLEEPELNLTLAAASKHAHRITEVNDKVGFVVAGGPGANALGIATSESHDKASDTYGGIVRGDVLYRVLSTTESQDFRKFLLVVLSEAKDVMLEAVDRGRPRSTPNSARL
jgi:hypothetical protein